MADDLKGFSKETLTAVSNVGDAIKEIQYNTAVVGKELRDVSGLATEWGKSYSNIKSLSAQILKTQDKSLLSSKGTTASVKAQNEANNVAKTLNTKINELLKNKVAGNRTLNDLIDKQVDNLRDAQTQAKILSEQYENLAISAASLDKNTKFFTLMSDVVKDVKGLRMLSSPFEAAAKASREQVLKNAEDPANKKSVFGAGAKAGVGDAISGMKDFFTSGGWIGALIKVIQFFIDAMFAADERVTKLAKGMMLTKDEARGVYNSLKDTKLEMDSIYNTTKDVTEAFTDLIELTEFVTSATNEMIESQIILTKNLGLSKEEAFGVQEAFVASNVEANIGKDIVYDQIAAFANQNKLISTGKKIFADIAKTSKLIQINFNGNLGSLVKTTLEAKKLGLTLDQVSKIGSSLLDFEQSISSELEAELLTGKDLNLEKARSYALNHDIAGLTQEIANQGITQEKFAAMNVIQQEAMAKSLGMSADEMGDMLYKGKVLNKVGGDTLKNLRERAKVSGDINLQNKVAALEQGILSGKSLEEAEKSTSAQEKFNQALEQAKEIFSDFVDGGFLDDLANAIKSFTDFVSNSSEENREYRKKARTLAENAKSEEEKKKYTDLGKQVSTPGIMDFLSLVQIPETLSKIFKSRSAKSQLDDTVINADDFTIKTNPKDTIVAMGGTKLGRTDEMVQLLTEQNQLLAGILNKEGTIVLNGTKMGTAMAVGSYRTQ
jgi:hypothetical protein